METLTNLHPVVVYLVDRPSFDRSEDGPAFRWFEPDDASLAGLDQLLGPHDEGEVHLFVDEHPAGPAWQDLLQGLVDERYRTVVTNLAPLSPAQRQQLIGVCAVSGAQLVTPGNAGGGIRA
ncbi:MAG TPA: hypothetical protein VLL77_08645 [Anaerolineales bacterium]|nr:hypothetical protein [Anaerolineales bacterium]